MLWLQKRLWPWLIAAASTAALLLMVRQNGRLKEREKAAKRAAQTQRRMRDAGSRVATDRRSLSQRLRSGRF
jgi:hypothetical protein